MHVVVIVGRPLLILLKCAVRILSLMKSLPTLHFMIMVLSRQQQEMEDSINNLGVVTTDKDVNDLAARHCEDAQVRVV